MSRTLPEWSRGWVAALAVLAIVVGHAAVASALPDVQDPSIEETDDPLVLQRLGVLYLQENRPRDALKALQRSVDLYAENGETHMWLGFAHFLLDDLEAAEDSYLRALAHNPQLTEVHNYLGLLYTKREDWARAEAEFEAALDDPAYPRASQRTVRINLGRMFLQRDDPAAALEQLREAVELVPERDDGAAVLTHLLLADALRALERPDEAISALQVVLDIQPDNADAHLKIGQAYLDLGRPEAARTHLEEVRRLVPGSALSEQAVQLLDGVSS